MSDQQAYIISELKGKLKLKDKEIADLQRLAERASIILDEHWDKLTGKDGYGPTSLESDLKKAASGKEYKDISKFADMVVRRNQKMESELNSAEREARLLAVFLWEKYYKEDSPEFEVCDSVAGVVSQIDNMVAGLSARNDKLERVVEVAIRMRSCKGTVINSMPILEAEFDEALNQLDDKDE